MRKFILTALLLTSVAAPVLAQIPPPPPPFGPLPPPPFGALPPPPIDSRDDRRDDRRGHRGDNRPDGPRGDRDERQDGRRDYRDDLGDDRRDFRDDRRDYRQDEGARYRGPAFYYPRGYDYRSYGPGVSLPRAYFTSRYFIDRPDAYRLSPVYSGTRWVRVGPDALLIRLSDGIVIRSVRGLFY